MTKNELKDALTLANIPFKAKAKLDELQALYDNHIASQAAANATVTDHGTGFVEEFTSGDEQVGFTPPVTDETAPESDEDDSFEAMLARFDPNEGDAECPHCEIHLSNGLLHVDDQYPNAQGETYRTKQDEGFTKGEYMCMGCGGHFGEPVVYTPKGTGIKIEKDREERNGIKRPSIGGKCRAVWDAMDELAASAGVAPTAKQVKAMAEEKGWNPNNASIEFYQWRKFNGITGRAPKAQ